VMTQPAWLNSPYNLPKNMYLDLQHRILRNVARRWLRVATHSELNSPLGMILLTLTLNLSSQCDLCILPDGVQDEPHVLFRCNNPKVCALRCKYASIYRSLILVAAQSCIPQVSIFVPFTMSNVDRHAYFP
jgi:hypothetical protein